jgi:acetoin utilization deacetylase AcuC-like enzyme
VTFLSLLLFGVLLCTDQLSINEETRAFAHFSNTEECANASAKLNRVNIACENGTPKSSFVLRYKQLKYSFTYKVIRIART